MFLCKISRFTFFLRIFAPKISSLWLTKCNETKALEGYKDELKPKFKSTPTQFQTIIFASSYTPNVGDHDGDVSVSQRTIERDLSALQKLGVLKREGKDNNGKWIINIQ